MSLAHARLERLTYSRQRGIDHDIAGDLDRAFVGVTLALDAGVALECAADVELGINNRPVIVDLHSLELGEIAPAAGSLGVLHVAEVGADLDGV
jgi:hypothetical protein